MKTSPVPNHLEAYLDIETTGLSQDFHEITVIGLYLVGESSEKFLQFVGEEICAEALHESLRDVKSLYTYNGSRFDLPFIRNRLGVDLRQLCTHRDLMYDCWRNNLFGGLKRVERQLGIERKLPDVSGYDAVRLWWRYVNDSDAAALATLIRYNREDVMNLKILKDILLLHLDGVYTT